MNFKKIHSFIICIMINAGFAMPAFAVSDANDENMTFAFVGDVMMGRTFPSIQLPPQDGAQLFTDAKPILKRVDMALGNLEGALCEGGTSTKGTGPNSYAFRTPPRYAKWLKDAGFDFMVWPTITRATSDRRASSRPNRPCANRESPLPVWLAGWNIPW